jgi:hypothetical protein
MSITAVSVTEPIKLVYLPEQREVVVFHNGLRGRAEFSKDYQHLEVAMKSIGLSVPLDEEKDYPHFKRDQRRIYLGDPDFGVAFYELYWHRTMNPDEFQWRSIKKQPK